MPSPVIKSFSKKSGKSEAEVEKLWDKAKDIVNKQYSDVEVESDRFYKLVTGILKNMLEIKENKMFKTFREFLKEKKLLESHFKVGEKVKCLKSGNVGEVVKIKGEGEDEVYVVKSEKGKMEYKPAELESVKE